MHPRYALCAAVLSLGLSVAACGDSSDGDRAAATPSATPTTSTDASGTPAPIIEKVTGEPTPLPEVTPSGRREPAIEVPKGDPPKDLVVKDLVKGKGPVAEVGKTLALDYRGVHFDTGKTFDSSWTTGQPFFFILGSRQALKGMDEGVRGMRVGGRRQLILPPELAYGDHGQGPIASNETIVFVVDLLKVF
jgi:peptidylprolyl isomerase